MKEAIRLPELPEGWTWTTVRAVSEQIHYGYTESANANVIGPKFLRITDIQNNTVDWDSVPFCKISNDLKEKYLLKERDLVFARTGATVGKSFLLRGKIPEAVFASYLIRIILHKKVDERFIFNFFNSQFYWSQIHASKVGIGQPNVNGNILSQIKLPLAPLPEQQRIVTKIEELFTKLDAGVDALKTARVQLGRYRQAVLKAAVTGELTIEWREAHRGELEPASDLLTRILTERRAKWEADQLDKMQAAGKPPKNDDWKQKYQEPNAPDTSELPTVTDWRWTVLETVADAIDPQPSHRTPPEVANGIPYVGMGDTRDKKIDLINARKVSADVLEEHKQRYQLKEGDFFIGKIGTIGKPVKLTPPFDYALSANLVLIQPKPTFTEEKFAFIYMASPLVEKLLVKGSRATTQAAFGIQKVRLLPYPLPPLAEQQQIVADVERLLSIADAAEQTIDQSLKQAERLRQSILQQAFTGKLVPQDPADEPAESLLARIKAERAQDGSATQKPHRPTRKQKQPAQPNMLP